MTTPHCGTCRCSSLTATKRLLMAQDAFRRGDLSLPEYLSELDRATDEGVTHQALPDSDAVLGPDGLPLHQPGVLPCSDPRLLINNPGLGGGMGAPQITHGGYHTITVNSTGANGPNTIFYGAP